MNAPLTAAQRGDRLPFWVIALLVVFVGLRVMDLYHLGGVQKGGRLSQNLVGRVDEKTMQATLAVSSTAKLAYLASYAKPAAIVTPDRKQLKEALKAAEELQTGQRQFTRRGPARPAAPCPATVAAAHRR